MAKVDITKDIAKKIKELRVINKIKAIDLAEHIGKSPAYISKLESGNIKTLGYDELLSIINYITSDDKDFEKIVEHLAFELDSNDLDEMVWLYNFDTVERKLPIPEELIDFINNKIDSLYISVSDLVEYINKNEDLNDIKSFIDFTKYKKNLWYSEKINDKEHTFIIMQLEFEDIKSILSKVKDISNYVTIKSVLYNLSRLEHGIDEPITDDQNRVIKEDVVKTLNKYKFYSGAEKSKILKTAVTKQEFDSLLNEFDINNRELINQMLIHISFLSDWNIKYTNERLSSFIENLKWDSSYIMTISSLPFHELGNISKSLKSKLIDNVENIIKEYKEKPAAEKSMEIY